MAERHPVYTDPGEPENPATPEEAEAAVHAAFPVAWIRRFDQHRRPDGSTMYVDTDTGQIYDAIPPMHSTDGADT